MSTDIQVRNGNAAGTTERDDFAGSELATMAETASTAVAAQARAQIEARYIMAMKRPRDWDDVRVRLLKECKRPSFAGVAIYHKPIGKGIEGPSIRFAETALRCMGNILPEAATVYDDPQKRIVRVTVTDLEANLTYSKDVTVDKTVERSSPKEGQQVLGVRTNSQGRKTYLVAATDDDLLNKEGALVSKAIRVNGLRLVPGDLIDEALWTIRETLKNADAQDPDTARNRIADGFAGLGVMPSDLKAYLGHDMGSASPAELTTLRGLFAAIRDGETTWGAALENKVGPEKPAQPQSSNGASKTESIKAKIKPVEPKAEAPTPEPKAQEPAREPGSDDAPGPDAEQEAFERHQAQQKLAPKPAAPKESRIDYMKDANAWVAHLASLETGDEVRRVFADRSGAFKRASVIEERRQQMIDELAKRGE